MEQYTIHDVAKGLASVGYIPTPKIAMAAHAAITHNRPLLLEGAPGTGKTQLAKSVADMLGCDLIRVQFYEGLNADKLIYDYDYQRQLLTIQAISATLQDNLKGLSVQDALQAVSSIDFYSENFLIERPLLRSIRMDRPCVLLLDEVDKASEEIEYALLEFLEDYSLSIPQLGTVRCHPEARPIVFLTSNRYRDLSDALKRRCRYLYIPAKTKDEILAILQKQVQADQKLMEAVAADVAALYARRDLAFKQTPSIAEAIDWLEYLQDLLPDEQASFQDSLSALMKTSKDTDYVQSHHHTLLAATLKVWDHLHRITWPKAKDRVQQPEENTKDRNADKDRNWKDDWKPDEDFDAFQTLNSPLSYRLSPAFSCTGSTDSLNGFHPANAAESHEAEESEESEKTTTAKTGKGAVGEAVEDKEEKEAKKTESTRKFTAEEVLRKQEEPDGSRF